MSNYDKMRRTNSKVRKWLNENGYKDIYMFPHSRFSKDYHITCGVIIADFDGIATTDDKIVLFQIKTNQRASKKVLVGYEELARIYGAKFIWFNWIDRKGLEINNEEANKFQASLAV